MHLRIGMPNIYIQKKLCIYILIYIHNVLGIGMANMSVDEEEFYAEGGSELATISQSPLENGCPQ
jgi:hypothetical protein